MMRRFLLLAVLVLLAWGAGAEEAVPPGASQGQPAASGAAAGTPSPARADGQAAVVPAPAAVAGPTLTQRVQSDPIALIGWTLEQAFQALGAPKDVFAFRGAEAWQDDVVFCYSDNVYLFWYRGRVWQVRVDTQYTGTILGLHMGDTRAAVIQTVARPYQDVDGSLVFFLPDASQVVLPEERAKGVYPLRLRVFFRDDRLADAYLYRGDF